MNTAMSTTMGTDTVSRNSKVAAILLLVLGFIAIFLPFVTGLSITIFAGTVMLIGGFLQIGCSFAAQGTEAFLWKLLSGAIYILGGLSIMANPGFGLLTFTLLLAGIFFVEGFVEVVSFFPLRELPGSGLILFNGIITLVLSVMIWRGWPSSSGWALGTLIGVNLITTGFTRLSYQQQKEVAA